MKFNRAAFTLVELLVVVAIIAVLAGLLFPVLASARNKARQTQCAAQLRQIGMSWLLYAEANDEKACPAYYYSPDFRIETAWDFRTATGEPSQPGLLATYGSSQIWRCPTFFGESWGRPFTGYGYNTTYIGGDTTPTALSAIEQPSETVAFSDSAFGTPPAGSNFLRAPSDPFGQYGTAHARHNGKANVAFADGRLSSRTLRRTITKDLGYLSTDDELYDLN